MKLRNAGSQIISSAFSRSKPCQSSSSSPCLYLAWSAGTSTWKHRRVRNAGRLLYHSQHGRGRSEYLGHRNPLYSEQIHIQLWFYHQGRYDSIIKAGFDFSQITWSVNEEKQIIRVTLPPVRILSHEIDLDSFKLYHEAESIFRQVTLDEHNAALTQMKKTAEQSAINNGLFEDAIQNAKTLLYGFFSQQYDLSQYQLEFSEQ